MLLGDRGARWKAKHRRNTNLLASCEHRKKGAIEDRMNKNGLERKKHIAYPTVEEMIKAESATSHWRMS